MMITKYDNEKNIITMSEGIACPNNYQHRDRQFDEITSGVYRCKSCGTFVRVLSTNPVWDSESSRLRLEAQVQYQEPGDAKIVTMKHALILSRDRGMVSKGAEVLLICGTYLTKYYEFICQVGSSMASEYINEEEDR